MSYFPTKTAVPLLATEIQVVLFLLYFFHVLNISVEFLPSAVIKSIVDIETILFTADTSKGNLIHLWYVQVFSGKADNNYTWQIKKFKLLQHVTEIS